MSAVHHQQQQQQQQQQPQHTASYRKPTPPASVTMEETFERASLLAACSKSVILNRINVSTASTRELRELVNMHNSVQIKHLPILFSKYVSKCVCSLIVQHKPSMKMWIHPESIRVCVEIDELSCINTNTSAPPPITLIVLKNIVTGALGLSLDNLEQFFENVQNKVGKINTTAAVDDDDDSGNVAAADADHLLPMAELPENDDNGTEDAGVPINSPKTFTPTLIPGFNKSPGPNLLINDDVTIVGSDCPSARSYGKRQRSAVSNKDFINSKQFKSDGRASNVSTQRPPQRREPRAPSLVSLGSSSVAERVNEYLNSQPFDADEHRPPSINSLYSVSPSQSASQCAARRTPSPFETVFDMQQNNVTELTDRSTTRSDGANRTSDTISAVSAPKVGAVRTAEPTALLSPTPRQRSTSSHGTQKSPGSLYVADDDDDDYYKSVHDYDYGSSLDDGHRSSMDDDDDDRSSVVSEIKILPFAIKSKANGAAAANFVSTAENFLSQITMNQQRVADDFDFD